VARNPPLPVPAMSRPLTSSGCVWPAFNRPAMTAVLIVALSVAMRRQHTLP
jgi:hypothetical protein